MGFPLVVSEKGGMPSGMDEMVGALSMGVGWRALALREVEVDNAVTLNHGRQSH